MKSTRQDRSLLNRAFGAMTITLLRLLVLATLLFGCSKIENNGTKTQGSYPGSVTLIHNGISRE